MRLKAALFLAVSALALTAPIASAAGPPVVGSAWSFSVQASSARLGAQINPTGLPTTYHFDYITEAAYQKNLSESKDGFTGGLKVPPVTDANINAGNSPVTVAQLLGGLVADTAYRYRVVAKNSLSGGYVLGSPHTLATLPNGGAAFLPDGRGWEMVTPVDKNGGQADPPGAIAGGGVLQAAASGGAITYGSSASFGEDAQGAAPASQYIATRTTDGWTTENITAPIFSGTYDTHDEGAPYQLFSADLARSLLFNGQHCRGEGSGCAVANLPLAGTSAPSGYQNYYLRDDTASSFTGMLTVSDVGGLALKPADFDVRLVGAAPDLNHIVVSSCAALTTSATEVPSGSGCDATKQNLYEWSAGSGLSQVNILPAQSTGNPGAALGAQSGAVSENGAQVYWSDEATGNLYLREGGQSKLVDTGSFQTASSDGAIAFYTKAGHLYRYDATVPASTDLTPSGGVEGVIGASEDGKYVYYVAAAGISLWHGGTTTPVAPASDATNYPPSTGTARVSADGTHLLFVSKASLTGYDNTDLNTGTADSEVYLYDATGALPLVCTSCNPTNERPIGPATIPGAIANGTAPGSTDSYKPRVLTTNGRRVFFMSRDTLAATDTNSPARDVYQWEAQGEGSCTRPAGCINLISEGRGGGDSTFVDASADGGNVFFLTEDSLVPSDPGSLDLYDARVGGGFAVPSEPTACEGDACQILPPPPVDPTLTTLTAGHGNPKATYHNLDQKKHHKKKHRKRHHRRGGKG